MSAEEVVTKFSRYAEPTLGLQCVCELTAFFLEGDLAQPARNCFAIAR
jgi:hypothetical protein